MQQIGDFGLPEAPRFFQVFQALPGTKRSPQNFSVLRTKAKSMFAASSLPWSTNGDRINTY